MKNFLKKYGGYLVGGAGIVALIVAFFPKSPPAPPQDRGCFKVTKQQLKTILLPGWNIPGNAYYAEALRFEVDESVDPNVIKITAWRKDEDDPTKCKSSNKFTIIVNPGQDCTIGTYLKKDNRYDLMPEDVGADTNFTWDELKIVPRDNPYETGSLGFDLDFMSGNTLRKAMIAKPCPPYCPVQ